MQHRYFGDVGDFGKYGLLRVLSGLSGGPMFKLGVVWYLFPDEDHNADGKHISYLRNPRKYRDSDEPLFDLLHSVLLDEAGELINGARQIKHAETSGMLSEGTQFYSEPLAFPVSMRSQDRKKLRRDWYAAALAATVGIDLVFVDPDNGVECKIKRTAKKGPKYVYWDDIEAFVKRGQSGVVYHHLNFGCPHPEQVEDKLRQMNERFGNGYESFAVRFKRDACRAYFIIAFPLHKDLLRLRLTTMLSGPWNRHFE